MTSRTPNTLPILSAHVLAAIYVAAYVGSIYVSKDARLSFSKTKANLEFGHARPKEKHERWRDDPDVIRARLVAVSSATVLCCVVASTLVRSLLDGVSDHLVVIRWTLTYLGVTPPGVLSLLITPCLFLGPLYACFVLETLPLQKNWSFQEDVVSVFFSIAGIRNYVVAPITEEIVFRACVLSGYHLANTSRTRMIFLCPMVFGAAHIHHAWDTYNRYGRSPAALKRAVIGTLFQFIYTTIFGFYCSYLFLRTGSIFPPIAAHVFCNVMGVPQPNHEIGQKPNRKLAILLAYFLGVVAFQLRENYASEGGKSKDVLPTPPEASDRVNVGTDLAPQRSLAQEPIPKSVSRVLDSARIRREYREKKRKPDDCKDNPREKRRRRGSMDEGCEGALEIKPGETIEHFNKRVESAMMPLVKTALRHSSAQERKIRKQGARESVCTRSTGDVDFKQGSAPVKNNGSSRRRTKASGHGEEPKNSREKGKEFPKTSTATPRRLSDIAQAPPEITNVPRGGRQQPKNDKHSGILSTAQKAMMEEEREKAIKHYRELKARRLRGDAGGTFSE
ncbi:hypothetical protein ID866_2217 [Astraeus odoratus]|nr:hypothetical protein ID866_2217 [Astraeus odoratus]